MSTPTHVWLAKYGDSLNEVDAVLKDSLDGLRWLADQVSPAELEEFANALGDEGGGDEVRGKYAGRARDPKTFLECWLGPVDEENPDFWVFASGDAHASIEKKELL